MTIKSAFRLITYKIPFREPVQKQHDVVTCIAPLFGNEQWQQALFAAHVYKRFGTHMHLYIRSMVSPVFELLKIYERELQFNPNINVEFRNQAAAQTDCLLQYKESANYVSFVDLDDVLIPRLAGNYLDEFAHLFNSMPNVAYIHYAKENFERVSETGKLVADPRYVNSTWIHFPLSIMNGMERYVVPNNVNAITHLKHMKLDVQSSRLTDPLTVPTYNPSSDEIKTDAPLLTKQDIKELQNDFERMARLPEVVKVFPKLPKRFSYLEAISRCYEDTYYKFHYSGRLKEIKCPGPDRCVVGYLLFNTKVNRIKINRGF
ncbi:unnamed protein product [Cylicostephanus goldi]|uniref:Glycosyltransferase family 92 protein n=1 Tax=Cylicostephanus goldi TaxID=71465 RepID=A0A3P7MN10_CYLGO|nr:unnamed protein product [Cylicostephanus goldi]